MKENIGDLVGIRCPKCKVESRGIPLVLECPICKAGIEEIDFIYVLDGSRGRTRLGKSGAVFENLLVVENSQKRHARGKLR